MRRAALSRSIINSRKGDAVKRKRSERVAYLAYAWSGTEKSTCNRDYTTYTVVDYIVFHI